MSGFTHEFQCRLAVARERAFTALTDANELKRWFAEHVEVEPRSGGAFRFWGKHTYGTPTRAQATQRLLRYEPSAELAFSWTIHDQPGEVSFTIEPDPAVPEGVIVKGKHQLAALPHMNRAKEMLDDLWRLQMGNLQAHVSGSQGVLLPDYTDAAPQVRLSILIDAPRERVFQAMLQPELLNKWIACAAEVEPRVGGRYSFGWKFENAGIEQSGGPTRILELVENEKLVTDWPDWRSDPSLPKQKITWLLESVGAQTRVTMIHSDFTRAVDFSDYPFGWQFFMSQLKAVAEGRESKQG